MRLALDVAGEAAAARLRLVGAVVVAVCIVVVMLTARGLVRWLPWLGWVAVIWWTRAWLQARQRIADAATWYLELGAQTFVLCEGGKRLEVAWGDVSAIEVDEERLRIEVRLHNDEPVAIEPRYAGHSIYSLHAALEAAWHRAG